MIGAPVIVLVTDVWVTFTVLLDPVVTAPVVVVPASVVEVHIGSVWLINQLNYLNSLNRTVPLHSYVTSTYLNVPLHGSSRKYEVDAEILHNDFPLQLKQKNY